METRKIEVEVTPEINDIGVAFKGMIVAYKEAKKDGWQSGTDIPAILMSSFGSLTTAFEGMDKAGAEAKEAPVKAVMGALLPITEGIELLLEKDEKTV